MKRTGAGEMILSLLEIQLAAICYDTDTAKKCLKAMAGVSELMHGATTPELEDLDAVVDILFARGNTIILEGRGEL